MCVCVRVCHFNPFNPCSPATTISVCLRFEINFWIMTELWYFPLAGKATSGRGCLKRRGAGRGRCTRSFNYLFWAQKIETTNKQTNDGSENLQHSHDLFGGCRVGWARRHDSLCMWKSRMRNIHVLCFSSRTLFIQFQHRQPQVAIHFENRSRIELNTSSKWI